VSQNPVWNLRRHNPSPNLLPCLRTVHSLSGTANTRFKISVTAVSRHQCSQV